ncbi:MAG: hypothetical protein IPG51_12995 [Chloroflexi bacterium]|nr:hypothetical protein [Chloroflexota bacterium]
MVQILLLPVFHHHNMLAQWNLPIFGQAQQHRFTKFRDLVNAGGVQRHPLIRRQRRSPRRAADCFHPAQILL